MRRINIALVIHELTAEGGGERQILCLARALSQKGHDITLYTTVFDRKQCFPEICKDLNIKEIGRGWLPWLQKPRFLRGYLDMLRLASSVDSQHEIWNPHHSPAQWAAVWLKDKLGGAVVWMCNDVPNFYDLASQPQSLSGWLRAPVYWLYYCYDRIQNRAVDLALFLSNWAESQFKPLYATPTRVVRSGADPEYFRPGGDRSKIRNRFGYNDSDFVLLWLGIFMPHRRLQDAIHAVSSLKARGVNVRLLLAGSDYLFPEYFKSLVALTRELRLNEEVTFAGKVMDGEIRDFYCACDAFLYPNENQTWGLAVLEAMACGAPVLVSTGAAVHEILTDNETALLFPPHDPKALAEKIQKLVDSPQLRHDLAAMGMQLVRSRYNWECFAEQVAAIVNEVAESLKHHPLISASAACRG